MIGIICAMAVELEGLKEIMDNREDVKYAGVVFTTGIIEGKEVVAAECGFGKVNAAMCAQIMIDRFSPEVIVNSGVAGALVEDVTLCDMVVATEVVQHDMNATALGISLGEVVFPNENKVFFACDEGVVNKLCKISEAVEGSNTFKGRIASGDLFVTRRSKRERINIRFNALACEMEGAAIGQVCDRNEIPFGVFRVISDDLTKNQGMDFKAFCRIAGRRSINIISEFIKKY